MASPATRYHHGGLREALLARAETVLARDGAAGLSLRALARDVGVSHGAPRRHFPDRQALLDALALQGFARLRTELEGAAGRRPSASFGDRLAALARAYVGFATEHAALLDLMFAAKHRPGAEATLRPAADAAFAPALALVADGQAAGEVVPGDPEEVGLVVWAAVQGLAAFAGGGMLERDALPAAVDTTVRGLVDGLRVRG